MTDINDLSDRECQILHLVAKGASNKQIARELYISTNTVKVHLRNIFAKIGVASRTEAAMFAVSAGLVDPSGASRRNSFVENLDRSVSLNANASSPADPQVRLTRIIVRNPWLVGSLVVAVLALGLVIFFLLDRRQSSTLASENPPFVTLSPRWREKALLPTAKYGLAVVAYENMIYAIAGETQQGITGSLERYDPVLDTWSSSAPKPLAVKEINAAVIGGLIYVPGGRLSSGTPTDVLEVYDPRQDQWQQRSSLPRSLSAYAMTAFEGKLFLFGGWDGENYVANVYKYDPDLDNWEELTPMPTARGFAGAAAAGGKIYVVGGFNGNRALAVNEEYQPEADDQIGNPWSKRAPLPMGRYAMGVISVADIIHIVGGKSDLGFAPPLEYFPFNDTWQETETPPKPIGSDLGLALLETRLYVIGGLLSEKPSNQNMEYQAIYTISLPIVR